MYVEATREHVHCPRLQYRYTLYDLTGYEIALWKTRKEPVTDHDRVYLIYRKYPRAPRSSLSLPCSQR